MFLYPLYWEINDVMISGKLFSLPLAISKRIKSKVMFVTLFPIIASTIFSFLSLFIMGLRNRLPKSRLPLITCCSHCVSANTFSCSPFSRARSISDFAYLDARRGFGIFTKFQDPGHKVQALKTLCLDP